MGFEKAAENRDTAAGLHREHGILSQDKCLERTHLWCVNIHKAWLVQASQILLVSWEMKTEVVGELLHQSHISYN